MAVKPGYITGANARVKIAGKTLAYCTDVSYNVTVQTIPIESMGKYEVHSNEPVSYTVDGGFSIIRYTKKAKALVGGAAAATGNGVAYLGDGDTKVKEHLDPGSILTSETFDLDLFQNSAQAVADSSTGTEEISFLRITDCRVVRRGATLNKRGVLVENFAFVGVLLHDSNSITAEQVLNSGADDLS